MSEYTTQITVRLPVSLAEGLDFMAENKGITRNALILEYIRRFLKEEAK